MQERELELLISARSGDEKAREQLIQAYISFIKQAASNYCKRYLEWENDDELSIAMLAFNEAVDGYDFDSGKKFENYARMVIKSRLVDFFRKESRHHHLPLEMDSETEPNYSASLQKYQEEEEVHNRGLEMELFEELLSYYGLSLDLLENSAPTHRKTRDKLVKVAEYIASRQDLREYLTSKKKLPLKELVLSMGLNKKVLKRGREYIIGVCLIILDERFSYLRSLFSLSNPEDSEDRY